MKHFALPLTLIQTCPTSPKRNVKRFLWLIPLLLVMVLGSASADGIGFLPNNGSGDNFGFFQSGAGFHLCGRFFRPDARMPHIKRMREPTRREESGSPDLPARPVVVPQIQSEWRGFLVFGLLSHSRRDRRRTAFREALFLACAGSAHKLPAPVWRDEVPAKTLDRRNVESNGTRDVLWTPCPYACSIREPF